MKQKQSSTEALDECLKDANMKVTFTGWKKELEFAEDKISRLQTQVQRKDDLITETAKLLESLNKQLQGKEDLIQDWDMEYKALISSSCKQRRIDEEIMNNQRFQIQDQAELLKKYKIALKKCHMRIGDDVYAHATKCDVISREAFMGNDEGMFVYLNKRTGELLVQHSGVCALTYELLGEL